MHGKEHLSLHPFSPGYVRGSENHRWLSQQTTCQGIADNLVLIADINHLHFSDGEFASIEETVRGKLW